MRGTAELFFLKQWPILCEFKSKKENKCVGKSWSVSDWLWSQFHSVSSTLITMDIQQKNKKQTNSYWSCSQPNWQQVQFDTGTQPQRFDMKVTTTLALPVYLILSAGANRSQPIDLIKENNGWPHQVSLIENKHKTHTENSLPAEDGQLSVYIVTSIKLKWLKLWLQGRRSKTIISQPRCCATRVSHLVKEQA